MKCYTLLLILLLGTLGCTSTQVQTLPPGSEIKFSEFKTRADILNALGGPNNIIHHDEGQSMSYTCRRGAGGGLSVSYSMPIVSIKRKHTCSDTVVFHLDSQDRVTRYTLLPKTDLQSHSIWPFGD